MLSRQYLFATRSQNSQYGVVVEGPDAGCTPHCAALHQSHMTSWATAGLACVIQFFARSIER
jgi:hypothetical protein